MSDSRKIIHIDMDAFYAAIEQRDNPALVGKPIAVGGGRIRGVVATASYEARKFGVKSAMSGVRAAKLCPELIFVTPRFEAYHAVSRQIREIFYQYTDLVEPLSLDEAYLDVTVNKKNIPFATHIAELIREEIFAQTGLTASAGISYNKFLAKVASDINKPNGSFVIKPKDAISFMDKLPVEKFYGIGKKTAEKMKILGITDGKKMREQELSFLIKQFGKSGKYFYDIVRGIDLRPVRSHWERKSIGTERTFEQDLQTPLDCQKALSQIAKDLHQLVCDGNYQGKTMILKIKYHDFEQHTHGKTLSTPITELRQIELLAQRLLCEVETKNKKVRLMGLTITNFFSSVGKNSTQLMIEM